MAVESPNTLQSNQRIKIVDLLGEGTIYRFTPVSGISGTNPLCSVYLNDIPVINGDGSPNWNISGQGFSFQYNRGTSGQSALDGFEKVEAFVPLPANTRVYYPPANQGFPQSPAVTFNTVSYPDAEAIKITLRVPAVYTVNVENGNTNAFDFTWAIDISTNNGPYVEIDEKSLTDIHPTPKCTSPYQFTKIYTLPKSPAGQTFYEWRVRVRRVTQNILSVNTQNELFLESIAVVSSNTYNYPMSAVAGLEMTADQFGSIPVRAYDIQGTEVFVPDGYTPTQYNTIDFDRACDVASGNRHIGVTSGDMTNIFVGAHVSGTGIPEGAVIVSTDTNFFTINVDPTATNNGVTLSFTVFTGAITAATYPGVWLGTMTERQWTDNPAWIFYDLVTNKRYGLGQYIRPEWLDKWTLYQIAQYCDEMVDDGMGGTEPRFACNVCITEKQDAYTLLNNLVSVFRGMLYWANGRLFPVGPEERDAVFTFTNANVIGGAFSYSDTPRTTRSTVCVVKWLDPDNLFRPTPERIEDIDGMTKYGYIEKQLTAFATTSRGQAIRAANWFLTVEQVLTETIAFQTDLEGLYLRPGDIFTVYDNYRNQQFQGGRILSWGTGQQSINLDKPITLEAGFTYFLSALVPSANIDPDDVTGSNQISLIRNSQLETRRVINANPATNVTTLFLGSGFSASLFKGSPWTLSASGSDITVFDEATPYRCLATNEPRPGIVEVLGVQNSTGINYRVNTFYSAETSPAVIGDTVAPNAPTGIAAHRVTGILNNNQFFDYVYISWSGSTSLNTAYYTLSGQLGAGAPYIISQALTTGQNYTPPQAGTFTFSVAAANANGYQSAFNRVTYVKANANPFGTTAPLNSVLIMSGYDPYYIRGSDARYTGYVGTEPTFTWNVTVDSNGNQVPTAQFITGYRVRLLQLGSESTVLSSTDISLSGRDNNILTLEPRYLYTGTTVRPLRGFTFSVDTVDKYGNIASGARLAVNNPQLPAPLNSGFIGYNGGITYNVTPRPQADTSGIFLWVDQSQSFTPTYDNVDFRSSNLAGAANIAPQQGIFYTWYSLVDSYGYSGSRAANGDNNATIYGPISGNADAMFGTFAYDITSQLTGAFGLLTGDLNLFQTALYQTGSTLLNTVIGLSGSITGAGAISTALNASIQTSVVNASGANSTQINAVSARLIQTGSNNYALAGTVMDALATTGGALSSWITQLGAQTTGDTATVKLMMDAIATGQVNGIGGAAIARFGFELDVNGKISSMKATSNSFQTYGTAVFSNLVLESDGFSAGSAGWQISPGGDVEFNNGVFRGQLAINSGTDNQILLNANGVTWGKPLSTYGYATLDAYADVFSPRNLSFQNASANGFTASFGNTASSPNIHGRMVLWNGSGSSTENATIIADGYHGYVSGRSLRAGTIFEAGVASAVDIRAVNLRVYNSNGDQTWRVNNADGSVYFTGDNQVYLHRVGNELWLNDANGDRPLT